MYMYIYIMLIHVMYIDIVCCFTFTALHLHSFTASQLRKLSHTSPGEWRHLNWPRLETTSLEWFMMFMAFEITGNPWILCSHRKGGFGVVFP